MMGSTFDTRLMGSGRYSQGSTALISRMTGQNSGEDAEDAVVPQPVAGPGAVNI